MNCVIFDLDNCLCDDRHRIPLIDHELAVYTRWDAYHAACDADEPGHVDVARAVLRATPSPRAVFITGRPEAYRAKTIAWLTKHLPEAMDAFVLLMRPNGDHECSVAMKRRALALVREAGLRPSIAFDDRADICEMYRQHDVPAFRLAVHDDMSPHGADVTPGKPEDWADVDALAELRPSIAPLRKPAARPTAADVLQASADVFRERSAGYKDNYKMVAPIVRALFPAGVPPELVVDDRWHLFELVIVKLTRLAVSELAHSDSAIDAAVYLAMIEAINQQRNLP